MDREWLENLAEKLGVWHKAEKDVSIAALRVRVEESALGRSSVVRYFDKSDLSDCKIRVIIVTDRDGDDLHKADSGSVHESEGGGGSAGDGNQKAGCIREGEAEGRSLEDEELHQERIMGRGGEAVGRRRLTPASPTVVTPPPKRAKLTSTNADVREIQVHAIMLAQCSPYFERAWTGGWIEKEDKAIEVQLPSVQAFEDFRLLLKLSYGRSFIIDEGEPLARDVMLRLIPLANSFEFKHAITEIAGPLRQRLTYDEAMQVCEVIPESLHGHEAVKELLTAVGDVVAAGLGSVQELWGHSSPCEGGALRVIDGPFSEKATALSLVALECALRSEDLDIEHENETYWLVRSWVENRCLDGCTEEAEKAFTSLIKCLRFHHYSLDYLAFVVGGCPWMRNTGMLGPVLAASICQRGRTKSRGFARDCDMAPPDRALSRTVEWVVQGHVQRAVCLGMKVGGMVQVSPGVVCGYPPVVELCNEAGKPELSWWFDGGVFERPDLGFTMPKSPYVAVEHKLVRNTGQLFRADTMRDLRFISDEDKMFANSTKTVSWAQFIANDSPYFEDDRFDFELRMIFPATD